MRETVAHQAGPGGNFFLVHVATPLEHCEKTDRSGVYAQARKGQVRGLAGIDDIFEVPKDANLTVDLSEHSIPQVVHSASLILPFFDDFPRSSRHRHCIAARDVRPFIVGWKIWLGCVGCRVWETVERAVRDYNAGVVGCMVYA